MVHIQVEVDGLIGDRNEGDIGPVSKVLQFVVKSRDAVASVTYHLV